VHDGGCTNHGSLLDKLAHGRAAEGGGGGGAVVAEHVTGRVGDALARHPAEGGDAHGGALLVVSGRQALALQGGPAAVVARVGQQSGAVAGAWDGCAHAAGLQGVQVLDLVVGHDVVAHVGRHVCGGGWRREEQTAVGGASR